MRIPAALRPLLVSLVAFATLYLVCAVRYAGLNFVSLQVFVNLISENAVLGICAVGMTMVILSGGIDLSVGALMSSVSILYAVLVTIQGLPPLLAAPVCLAAGASFGLGMGGLIHKAALPPFIVTLAGMFLARGLGYVLHLESLRISDPAHFRLAMISLPFGPWATLRIPGLMFLGVVLIAFWIARSTRFGRNIYALGGNEEAALLMGVPVGKTKVLVYGFSGLCSAFAGITLTLYQTSGSHIEGIGLELDAIAATVVGGTLLTGGIGSVVGTLIGVMTIGLILTVITTYEVRFSSGSTRVAIGGLLLVFVLLQRVLVRTSGEETANYE